MDSLAIQIRERYMLALERIAAAARAAGREPDAARLVVVSKAQPLEVVGAAYQAGVRLFGENYPEESLDKISSLGSQSGVEWHMIGHLQGRKAALVIAHFDVLESLDSLKLANRLERLAAESGRTLPVMLEFNVGGEQSKFGWPAAREAGWPAFYPDIEAILELPHLQVRGLMTMPPLETSPDEARLHFRGLRWLRDHLASRYPQADWRELSMGTSADYEAAVAEGATLVRIGAAILGSRPKR